MERCLRQLYLCVFLSKTITAIAIDLLGASQLEAHDPNYCNDTEAQAAAGLSRSGLGQFVGYDCSVEFFHCRWQSDGYYTYMKQCKPGLVFDTKGTQNCNFDYNVRGCSLSNFASEMCTEEEFSCPLSEMCVPMAQRCDGTYQCLLEEDEQNCPLCHASQFPCIVSEQCIAIEKRCNGIAECKDGTDERNCTECAQGGFFCEKSVTCVDAAARCNGEADCLHGEDELLCRAELEKTYLCRDQRHRIPLVNLCDGAANCPDGSDEAHCHMAIPEEYPRANIGPFSSTHQFPLVVAEEFSPGTTEELTEFRREDESEHIHQHQNRVRVTRPLTTVIYRTTSTTTTSAPPTPMRKLSRERVTATSVSRPNLSSSSSRSSSSQVTRPETTSRSRTARPSTSTRTTAARQITTGSGENVQSSRSIVRSRAETQTPSDEEVVFEVTSRPTHSDREQRLLDSLHRLTLSGYGSSRSGVFSAKSILEQIENLIAESKEVSATAHNVENVDDDHEEFAVVSATRPPRRTSTTRRRPSSSSRTSTTAAPSATLWRASLSTSPSRRFTSRIFRSTTTPRPTIFGGRSQTFEYFPEEELSIDNEEEEVPRRTSMTTRKLRDDRTRQQK